MAELERSQTGSKLLRESLVFSASMCRGLCASMCDLGHGSLVCASVETEKRWQASFPSMVWCQSIPPVGTMRMSFCP